MLSSIHAAGATPGLQSALRHENCQRIDLHTIYCVAAPYRLLSTVGVGDRSRALRHLLEASHQSQHQWPRSVICWAARGKGGKSQVPAAAADATGLLKALIQLASRTTIIVGSHQAYAILDDLESKMLQQLASIPTDTLASGLWAMTRLQLQPSEQLVQAASQQLLQPEDTSKASSGSSSSRLQLCSSHTFGTLCYSLNFFMLRDRSFWEAAAAAGLPHVQHLKPAGISNLLQGIAGSGWTVSQEALMAHGMAAAGPQTTATSKAAAVVDGSNSNGSSQPESAGRNIQQQLGPSAELPAHQSEAAAAAAAAAAVGRSRPLQGQHHEQEEGGHPTQQQQQIQDPVLRLLVAVEQLIVTDAQRLRRWRMRDISQLCQAFSLTGFSCSLLFAVVANHLLEYNPAAPTQQQPPTSYHSHGQGGMLQQQQQWQARGRQQQGGALWRLDSHAKPHGPARLLDCRPTDAVGLAWAFVHSFCPNQLLLQELAEVITLRARQLHAADVSRLLWAYATADVVDNAMLAAVTAAVAEEMHVVLPRTAAGAVWSLAMMGFEAPAFMEAALDRLAACLEATPVVGTGSTGIAAIQVGSSSSSSVCLGAPVAAGEGTSVLQQLYDSAPAVLLSAGPETAAGPNGELSRLSMLTQHSRRVINRRPPEQQQQQQADGSSGGGSTSSRSSSSTSGTSSSSSSRRRSVAQDSSNSSSSNSLFDEDHQQHLLQWQDQQQQQQQQQVTSSYTAGGLVTCTARDVAEAVYACGRLQHYNASLFRALRGKFQGLLPAFSSRELVEVLWGLARLRLYDSANMDAAAAELARRAPTLPAALVALGAWCFASLKHSSPSLSKALSARAVALAASNQLGPLDAAQLVRSAAKVGAGQEQAELFKACAQVLVKRLPRLNDTLLVGCLWSYAVAGVFDGELFAAGYQQINRLPPGKARPLLLLQLFQAETLLQDTFSAARLAAPARLAPGLHAAATRQWMFSNRRSPGQRSQFQEDVAQVLEQQLRLDVQQEVLTDDGLFSLDVAVVWQGSRVAVEVDGPDHFTNSMPHQLMGSSRAKQRCLQARDWAVLSVPFYVWNHLAEQQQQQQPQPAAGEAVSAGVPTNKSARACWLEAALDEAVGLAAVPLGLRGQTTAAATRLASKK